MSDDILLWSERHADLLRRRAAGELVNDTELDWPNIAEEIEDVGKSQVQVTGYAEAAEAAKMFTVLRKPYGIEDVNWALAKTETGSERKVLDFQSARRDRTTGKA